MRSMTTAVLAALLTLAAGGTTSDYVGNSYGETGAYPAQYWGHENAKFEGKVLIGRATVYTSESTDRFDLEEYIREQASKVGAEAVVVVSTQNMFTGIYNRRPRGSRVNYDDKDAAKKQPEKKKFDPAVAMYGNEIDLRGEVHGNNRREIRMLFYRNAASTKLHRRYSPDTPTPKEAQQSQPEIKETTTPESI
ncbi:MAG: hypothetical protein MJ025_02610 [Victivallaceae bacterium]|nr:hypothetical protein [Victivallaceae bacterium]